MYEWKRASRVARGNETRWNVANSNDGNVKPFRMLPLPSQPRCNRYRRRFIQKRLFPFSWLLIDVDEFLLRANDVLATRLPACNIGSQRAKACAQVVTARTLKADGHVSCTPRNSHTFPRCRVAVVPTASEVHSSNNTTPMQARQSHKRHARACYRSVGSRVDVQ